MTGTQTQPMGQSHKITPWKATKKGGEEPLPERTALFGSRIRVDKYGLGKWEGEVPDVRKKMRRVGPLDMHRVPKQTDDDKKKAGRPQ